MSARWLVCSFQQTWNAKMKTLKGSNPKNPRKCYEWNNKSRIWKTLSLGVECFTIAISSIYWNKRNRRKFAYANHRNAKGIFIFTLDKAKIATLAKLKAHSDVTKRSEKPSFGRKKELPRWKHRQDDWKFCGLSIIHRLLIEQRK